MTHRSHESGSATSQDDTRPAASGGSPAVGRLRAELARARASLDAIESELAVLDDPPRSIPERARPERYYQLLIEVYERGPHGVSGEELGALARDHGYDRRGLNGYFAGRRAPFSREDGRVKLTLEGRRLVHERLRREAGR